MRVAVVGGGIIGLSTAWQLAKAGCAVTVLDAAPASREASWAAAGMLAPHHEATPGTPLWRLCTAGLAAWHDFAQHLGSTAADLDLSLDGGLLPIGDRTAALADAESRLHALARHGVQGRLLRGTALRKADPALAADAALWLPGGWVDPRRCVSALEAACATAGVHVLRPAQVHAIEPGAVLLADGTRITCERSVIAAGAWTPQLAAASGVALSGLPVQGQLLRFAVASGLRHFVHGEGVYVVPRRYGKRSTVVGATMRLVGFDRADEPAAIAQLASAARALVPALRDGAINETWTGLRPAALAAGGYGLPVLGWAPGRSDLLLATGHFRNGIVLAPLTGQIVADLITGTALGAAMGDLAPFAPGDARQAASAQAAFMQSVAGAGHSTPTC